MLLLQSCVLTSQDKGYLAQASKAGRSVGEDEQSERMFCNMSAVIYPTVFETEPRGLRS